VVEDADDREAARETPEEVLVEVQAQVVLEVDGAPAVVGGLGSVEVAEGLHA
jgi:hypothetical protein